MKKHIRKLLIGAKQLQHRLRPPAVPRRFLHEDVPYFSQWESRELNKQIIEKQIRAEDDPNWRTSGAKTKDEYAAWSWNGCGMACLKMLLAHHTKKTIPLVTLGKKCIEYGGYTMPLETSSGLIYAPFVRFIDKEFGLRAHVATTMPLQEIIAALGKHNYVIASVSPLIRQPDSHPKSKGGHLVLMLGYDLDKREFSLHNPSGLSEETQEYATVAFKDFERFFNNRGVVVGV